MKPDDVNFVYHLKYDFDIAELNRIKDDTVKNEVNYRSWPYHRPKVHYGRYETGWESLDIMQMKRGEQEWPYEYLKTISEDFPFDNSGYYFRWSNPYFRLPIHNDTRASRRKQGGAWGTMLVQEEKLKEISDKYKIYGDELKHYADMMWEGPKCALLVKISEDDAPLVYTYENQVSWAPEDYTFDERDYKYYYDGGVITESRWTHYVNNGPHTRSIFRINIYDYSIEETKDLLAERDMIQHV